jgi:hypothetical protein
MLNDLLASRPALSRPSTPLMLKGRKKNMDARDPLTAQKAIPPNRGTLQNWRP